MLGWLGYNGLSSGNTEVFLPHRFITCLLIHLNFMLSLINTIADLGFGRSLLKLMSYCTLHKQCPC